MLPIIIRKTLVFRARRGSRTESSAFSARYGYALDRVPRKAWDHIFLVECKMSHYPPGFSMVKLGISTLAFNGVFFRGNPF